ncbi:Fic family protein [Vibrio ziniensis]|uniref:Fic family protein n=1 Tax=Vibrio ziniensis TaxID=2711221 RepID=A0A6G7CQ52_9VIBR|nr:Fic family protein [Vibrio ziniensis]QIH44222.1 Fic family protein [Vibrio ziniensis]
MARIRSPKPPLVLMEQFKPQEFIPLFGRYGVTDENGNYLHWDKFQWRVPRGTNPELAWLLTKMARNSISKNLTILHAKENTSFKYCVPDSLWAMLHRIDTVTGGGHKIGDSSFITNREKDRYLVSNLMMEEAITSSQLEGASTTRKVAKEMLETNRTPKDISEQMIFNNYLLMKRAVSLKDKPLTIDLILELHEIATFQAIDNGAMSGELRENNDITVANIYNEVAHTPPCHSTLRDRLNALCDFANESPNEDGSAEFIHPIVKAIILHFMIGYIHPFGDGNGRTARALFYWFMLKSGYWLFEYVSISKLIQEKRSEYDTAFLYTETDDFDLTYFIYHQVDIVARAVNSLHEYIETKKNEFYQFMEWIDKSPISQRLKRGSLEILKTAVKQPGRTFTAKVVSQDLGVNENTARTYLNDLVEENLLLPSHKKGKRGITYIAPVGLREQLKL